jgi:hypothetical protein
MADPRRRTTIRATPQNSVILRVHDPDHPGQRLEREFRCPDGGGYVREALDGEWINVGLGLKRLGPRLWAGSPDALLDVVRHEWTRERETTRRHENDNGGHDDGEF